MRAAARLRRARSESSRRRREGTARGGARPPARPPYRPPEARRSPRPSPPRPARPFRAARGARARRSSRLPTSGRATAGELGDLPKPAHAHLDDDDLGLRLDPAERQRQADLVVVASLGDHRRCVRGGRALRGCPSSSSSRPSRSRRRPGPGSGREPRGRAPRAPRRRPPGRGSLPRRASGPPPRTHCRGQPRRRGRLASTRLESIWTPVTCVHAWSRLETPRRERRRSSSSAERDHADTGATSRRSSSRATSRSSNGIVRPASSCPGSWPLPAIDDDVAFAGAPESARDRNRPIRLDQRALPGACEDLLDDRERILAPRIVRGDEDDVGEARRDRTHERALLAIPVSTASEHADDAIRRERPRLGKDVLERLRRVRVVDEHGEGLPFVDRLEPAGHSLEMLDPAPDRPRRRSRGAGAAATAPRTFSTLKRPRKRLCEIAGRSLSPTPSRRAVTSSRMRPDVRVGRDAEREKCAAELTELSPPADVPVVVADVHDCGRQRSRPDRALRRAAAWPRSSPPSSRGSRDDPARGS